jgi:hypothetical protein
MQTRIYRPVILSASPSLENKQELTEIKSRQNAPSTALIRRYKEPVLTATSD